MHSSRSCRALDDAIAFGSWVCLSQAWTEDDAVAIQAVSLAQGLAQHGVLDMPSTANSSFHTTMAALCKLSEAQVAVSQLLVTWWDANDIFHPRVASGLDQFCQASTALRSISQAWTQQISALDSSIEEVFSERSVSLQDFPTSVDACDILCRALQASAGQLIASKLEAASSCLCFVVGCSHSG